LRLIGRGNAHAPFLAIGPPRGQNPISCRRNDPSAAAACDTFIPFDSLSFFFVISLRVDFGSQVHISLPSEGETAPADSVAPTEESRWTVMGREVDGQGWPKTQVKYVLLTSTHNLVLLSILVLTFASSVFLVDWAREHPWIMGWLLG